MSLLEQLSCLGRVPESLQILFQFRHVIMDWNSASGKHCLEVQLWKICQPCGLAQSQAFLGKEGQSNLRTDFRLSHVRRCENVVRNHHGLSSLWLRFWPITPQS